MHLKSIYGDNLEEFIYAVHNYKVIWDGTGECPF